MNSAPFLTSKLFLMITHLTWDREGLLQADCAGVHVGVVRQNQREGA